MNKVIKQSKKRQSTGFHIALSLLGTALPLIAAGLIISNASPNNLIPTKTEAAGANFIYRDGTKLMLNGQQYKFAGYNADTWFGCWPNEVPTDAQLDKYFSELNPHSMTRIWPYPGSDLTIMDRIVASAERHNQYLAVSLMDGNRDCGEPAVNYANPTYELAWISQIVPRYANSHAIGFWELINEPNGSDTNLKSYYQKLSDKIRSLDPNHLIGTGSHAAWSGGEAKYISDHDLPNIDLISMHEYDAATGVSHWGAASTRASQALNKPWYAGEDGFCCGGGSTGTYEGNASKLKAEWDAYLAVPENAGMMYWDFKLGYPEPTTASFGNALWTVGTTYRHAYHALNPVTPTETISGTPAPSLDPTATPSPTLVPTATPTPVPTSGLTGTYYNGIDFTSRVLSRNDKTINFDWGTGAPVSGVKKDNFSVRWTGKVSVPTSGTYTFYTLSDERVRLYVNGTQLVNNWTSHTATTNQGTISLTAGTNYTIQVDYADITKSAVMKLEWSGPGISKTIVPQQNLFVQ